MYSDPMSEGRVTSGRRKTYQLLRSLLIVLILSGLLWWALKKAPLEEIGVTLKRLTLAQIGILLAINVAVILLITARWWLIARAGKRSTPFLPLVWYRLSVFGLSYFTPGPQVGGEPLQVIYLQQNHGFTYVHATSTVIMDKLIEFLANFILLAVGLWAVFRTDLLSIIDNPSTVWLSGLGILLVWPILHISLLYRNILPASKVLNALPFIPQKSKAVRMVTLSEKLAAAFCQRHPRVLLGTIGVSILSLVGITAEYFLMADFLGIRLDVIEIFAALTLLQLAFLVPLPGGLGALEASQVFALGAFGQPASAAISLTLLQRARDILNGGLGLLIAGKGLHRPDRSRFRP
ncbi:MAG TPA: lysylphosphatidylglycerol synthase transmembrane domain-containing protein [Anaerolineales bacterium]|nr:lysylphosphatidylglycerol synthase transmembrane domain-containing protein [Anaerolineales bacterium]